MVVSLFENVDGAGSQGVSQLVQRGLVQNLPQKLAEVIVVVQDAKGTLLAYPVVSKGPNLCVQKSITRPFMY